MLTEPLREGRAWQTGNTLKAQGISFRTDFRAPTLQHANPQRETAKESTIDQALRKVDEIKAIAHGALQGLTDNLPDVAKLDDQANKLKGVAKMFQKNTGKLLSTPARDRKDELEVSNTLTDSDVSNSVSEVSNVLPDRWIEKIEIPGVRTVKNLKVRARPRPRSADRARSGAHRAEPPLPRLACVCPRVRQFEGTHHVTELELPDLKRVEEGLVVRARPRPRPADRGC